MKKRNFKNWLEDIWDKYYIVILGIVVALVVVGLFALVVGVPNDIKADKVDGGVVIDKCIIGQYAPGFYFVVYIETEGKDVIKTIEVSLSEYYSTDIGDIYIKDKE